MCHTFSVDFAAYFPRTTKATFGNGWMCDQLPSKGRGRAGITPGSNRASIGARIFCEFETLGRSYQTPLYR